MKKLDVKILDARMRDELPHYATSGSAGTRHRARQPRRADRFRLSGPDLRLDVEPRQHAVRAEPAGTPRATGRGAGGAGRIERGRRLRPKFARAGRFSKRGE